MVPRVGLYEFHDHRVVENLLFIAEYQRIECDSTEILFQRKVYLESTVPGVRGALRRRTTLTSRYQPQTIQTFQNIGKVGKKKKL